jgi:hypothetical protein
MGLLRGQLNPRAGRDLRLNDNPAVMLLSNLPNATLLSMLCHAHRASGAPSVNPDLTGVL